MPENSNDNVHQISDYQQKAANPGQTATLKGGGGGGTYDDMEPRVTALEEGLKRIEGKIDTLVERTFEMKGQLSAMPSAVTFGDIKGSIGKLEGRIDRLPTTAKVGTLVSIIGGIVLVITKWAEIRTFFGH